MKHTRYKKYRFFFYTPQKATAWQRHLLQPPQRPPSLGNTRTHRGTVPRAAQREARAAQRPVHTLVILPPLELAKRFRESVSTLDVLWMLKRLLAGTFLLHLRGDCGQHAPGLSSAPAASQSLNTTPAVGSARLRRAVSRELAQEREERGQDVPVGGQCRESCSKAGPGGRWGQSGQILP